MNNILTLLAEDSSLVIYRKSLRPLCGSVNSSILFSQMIYWFGKKDWQPFYKFIQPCQNAMYKDGDSWCEELGFSYDEFTNAFSKIGTRYKSKTEYEANFNSEAMFLSYSDKISGMTYWVANKELITQKLNDLYTPPNYSNSTLPKYVIRQSRITDLGKVELQYTDTTSETTSEENVINNIAFTSMKKSLAKEPSIADEKSVLSDEFFSLAKETSSEVAIAPETIGAPKPQPRVKNGKANLARGGTSDYEVGEYAYERAESLTEPIRAYPKGGKSNVEISDNGKVTKGDFENEVIRQLKSVAKMEDLVRLSGRANVDDVLRAFAEDFANAGKNLSFKKKNSGLKVDFNYENSRKGVGEYFKKWAASNLNEDETKPSKLEKKNRVTVDFSSMEKIADNLMEHGVIWMFANKNKCAWAKVPQKEKDGVRDNLMTLLKGGMSEDAIIRFIAVFTWTTGEFYSTWELANKASYFGLGNIYHAIGVEKMWQEAIGLDGKPFVPAEKSTKIMGHIKYYYDNKR